MLTFVNTSTTPNKGFVWRDNTGFEVRSNNFNVALDKIKDRLISRGLYVGAGWQDQVIHDMCLQTNGNCEDKTVPVREVSWQDFENFGLVAKRHIDNGGKVVSKEEAERRAAICVNCPKNAPLKGVCNFCAGLMTWAVRLAGNLNTSKDEDLHQCQICSCQLRLAVHIPLDVMLGERFDASNYPNFCWKKPL